MDDFKEKGSDSDENKEEEQNLNSESGTADNGGEEKLSSTFDKNTEDVKSEMDELAKTFQRELDKVKEKVSIEEEDTPEILIQSLEDIPVKTVPDEPEEIPEEELCECCGEKRRGTYDDPDSHYCNDCDEGLRHYPFDFLKVFLVLIVIALVFYSGYIFASNMSIFVSSKSIDKLVSENKISSALNDYSELANTLVTNKVSAEMIYKREIIIANKIGYVDEIPTLGTNFKKWELNLPHLKKVKDVLQDVEDFTFTAEAIDSILSEYSATDPSGIPYDEVLAKITALETAQIPSTTAESTTLAAGETTTSAPAVSAKNYNKAMIYYFKAYLAQLCGKDLETQIKFGEQIKNEYPQYVWLYGTMLGNLYCKTGQDVTEICSLIREVNSEDYSADVFEIKSLRIKGEYDAAIEKCEVLIAAGSEVDYELYRNEALCYLAKGDYDSAYTVAAKAYDAYNYSIEVVDTYALCAAVVGKEDIYTQMQTLLTTNGYDLSDSVTGYKAGTLTLDDILLKGEYDV